MTVYTLRQIAWAMLGSNGVGSSFIAMGLDTSIDVPRWETLAIRGYWHSEGLVFFSMESKGV